jgi:hypothetical protein
MPRIEHGCPLQLLSEIRERLALSSTSRLDRKSSYILRYLVPEVEPLPLAVEN